MNKSQMTPGPWEIEYDNADDSGGGQWYNVGPAQVWWPYGSTREERVEALANARAIAALPDLVEALRQIAGEHKGQLRNSAKIARAALAKLDAEGGAA